MINIICGFVAVLCMTLFVGGLAYSIWDNTGSIAFVVISAIVLTMVYWAAYDEIRSGPNHV